MAASVDRDTYRRSSEKWGSHSCSKICLVKAYPAGQKEKDIKMYAVLDEQSNKSLTKTEFFNLFEVTHTL